MQFVGFFFLTRSNSFPVQMLSGKLEERENELNTEKKNALKRDKTIQGLTQVVKDKDREVSEVQTCDDTRWLTVRGRNAQTSLFAQIAELCHEIEDRDDALAKARETAHKAQLQKYQVSVVPFLERCTSNHANQTFLYSHLIITLRFLVTQTSFLPQGAEEHQSLIMAVQSELAQLQGEHHGKVLEAQKLQHSLDRKEEELADLQQAKEQLERDLEDLQQQKKKGDKALNVRQLEELKRLSGVEPQSFL